ncbi:MAG: ABC transporter substrate-binding protein [Candidatus Methanofastidiosa archaeon]|nr:ABC transporter substrate-binding protein [Candidatus Methanofastidiosa archaeon]
MIRKGKRLISLLIMFIFATMLFTGCANIGQSQQLKIGHVAKPGNLLLYLANDLGYFEEEGIDAELRLFENDEEGIAAVVSGEIDTGTFKSMPELLAIDAGEDLRIVGGGQQNGYGIYTLEENEREYDFLKNYRGKTIGTIKNSAEDVLTKAAISRLCLEEEIKVVEFNTIDENVEAIRNGVVDAGTFCTSDLDKSQREGLRFAVKSNELLEKHPSYTQIMKDSSLKDRRNLDLLVRFNRATLKAYKHYLENPEETVNIILNYVDSDRDMLMGDIYDENKEFFLEYFWPNPNPIRAYNWKFLEDLELLGYLKSDKDILNDYAHDPSYVEAMNQLADETADPVYIELKSIHVC